MRKELKEELKKVSKNDTLPMFGIGPIYVIICLSLTVFGIYLVKYVEFFKNISIYITIPILKEMLVCLGIITILIGIIFWIYAVIVQNVSKEITNGKLLTTGVYGIVRNPIYSAFLFIFTGILISINNLLLYILPIVFYIFLTILLKLTEEKWLIKKFGKEYIEYCNNVNRIIPRIINIF